MTSKTHQREVRQAKRRIRKLEAEHKARTGKPLDWCAEFAAIAERHAANLKNRQA